MIIPTVTALPIPPTRADSANFDTRGDVFMPALVTLADEINATVAATNLATAQVTADAAATAADVVTCAGHVSDAGEQVGLAAAQVTLAAGQVTLATAQADRAEENADRAGEAVPAWNGATAYDYPQLAAATDGYTYRAVAPTTGDNPTTDDGSNWVRTNGVPKITAGDAAKVPVVNAGGTAYELSALKTVNGTSVIGSGDVVISGAPIGSEMLWPTETPPTGFLEENGASLLRTGTYAALFAVIGTTYGAADATHFNLPDARGRFPRIWAHGATTDPDRASRTANGVTGATMTAGDHVGTNQADGFKAHTHTINSYAAAGSTPSASVANASGTMTTSSVGGSETRPVNTYRMMIIKY